MCVGSAPDRFALDKGHRSQPLAAVITPDERVLDAAASCPVEVIEVLDNMTGEPIPWEDA